MKVANINTDGLLNLETRDAISFLNALLTYNIVKEAKDIHTGLVLAMVDKKNPLMTNVTVLVQTFDGTDENGRYFVFTQSRGTKCGTSNSIKAEETDKESWLMEAHFIKRYKELV